MKTVVDLVSSLKTYFTGKDTAAKQAVEQNIAPVETDATSSSAAYSVGDQLILNDILYDVTAPISISNALVVGTNIAPADDLYSQMRTLETNLTNLGNAAYQTSDSTASSIDNADYIPFYDTSASAKKRILKSNLVPSINSTLSSSSTSPVQNKVVSKALGTVETIGGTATKAYSKDDLMLASTGQLYSVTADISQGGSITSGGNVKATDGIVSQIGNLAYSIPRNYGIEDIPLQRGGGIEANLVFKRVRIFNANSGDLPAFAPSGDNDMIVINHWYADGNDSVAIQIAYNLRADNIAFRRFLGAWQAWHTII